ncbi:STAS domain-containing protein [Hamadaea tsunoensis]|uniref:STAS domain-containing protein n=1 Tax=Hamadaea tsunoensis TaxID=53368 RepID=UPI0003F504A6|nr:STAS domain-containing protein [Hamadaea tsunoensis]
METNTALRLAAVLADRQDAVVEAWSDAVRETLRGRLTRAELDRQLADLYTLLRTLLESGSSSLGRPDAADLRSMLSDLSHARARQGFSVSETAISVFALKAAFYRAAGDDDHVSKADFAAFSLFIDDLGLHTVETYVAARDSIITEQSQQLMELSTPVVKLWDGVVAVPLIGTLDSARSQIVMERLLQALVDTGSPYAILDITGVPAVDTQVAQHILKTVVAAQLMGAQCIISGIRPQIAQTIVSLGIEFGEIVTKANLSDALQYALRSLGTDIGKRAPRGAVI